MITGVERFYPNLSKQEIRHAFPKSCPVNRILLMTKETEEKRIAQLEALLARCEDREDFFDRFFTNCGDKEFSSEGILLHFKQKYSTEYANFLKHTKAVYLLELRYLSDKEKLTCWKQNKLTKRDFYDLWQAAIQDQDVLLARLLLKDDDLFTFEGVKESHLNLLSMLLQFKFQRAKRDFIWQLLQSPLILPQPVLGWALAHNDKEMFQAIKSHPLFEEDKNI